MQQRNRDGHQSEHGMSAAELRHHLSNLGAALIRIEHKLLEMEVARTPATGRESGSSLTLTQWLKVLAGVALPLLALLLALTGNIEAARRLMAP